MQNQPIQLLYTQEIINSIIKTRIQTRSNKIIYNQKVNEARIYVIDQQAQEVTQQTLPNTEETSTNVAQRPPRRIIKPEYLKDFV